MVSSSRYPTTTTDSSSAIAIALVKSLFSVPFCQTREFGKSVEQQHGHKYRIGIRQSAFSDRHGSVSDDCIRTRTYLRGTAKQVSGSRCAHGQRDSSP